MIEPLHRPVLEAEVVEAFAPSLSRERTSARIFVDLTCGLAGHTRAVIDRLHPNRVIAFDRDPQAQALAKTHLATIGCPVEFVLAPFSTLASVFERLGIVHVDAILADLGVSSMQLDSGARGFSFRFDGPLDMRMNPQVGESAATLIANTTAPMLTRILREYGEEPDASRIAEALVLAKPQTTAIAAHVIEQAMSHPQRRKLGKRIHPATRTFQALRIAVNHELEELDTMLAQAPSYLVPGGRLAVITFHSLEDRRVKQRFRSLTQVPQPPVGVPVLESEIGTAPFGIPSGFARGVVANEAELANNPRSRSARLRVLERRR